MNRPWPFRTRGRIAALVVIVALIAAAVLVRGCPRRTSPLASVTTEAVERRDISVTVEATGTVEPINLVEVKSKASGQITRMPVEIGSVVQAGDLLVQVDPRDVRNAFDQAQAVLVAAEARARVAALQRKRADDLVAEQVITGTEHETALLDDANAKSQLVAARTNLDIARQRLEDATVRAPIAGTILEKPVSVGQVISSATSSVSGGTTLLRMAALSRIRMRALVVETDIGKLKEGQSVTVVVDAYPQRQFRGTVEQIEPQAVVQQSVTMFPVLVSISNEDGLLMPGMNGEVTMLVDERRDVLAVPLDAVRGMREFSTAAASLGLDMDSLRAGLRNGALGGPGGGGGAAPAAMRDGARARAGRAGPDSAWGQRMRRGERPFAGGGMDSARAARWRQRMAARAGGAGGAGDMGGPGSPGVGMSGSGGSSAGAGAGNGSASRRQIAVVKTASGLTPRLVRLGLSDYDYAEVLDGLNEGEQVVMLGALEIQRERDQMVSRVRERMGGGVTGTANPSTGTRRPGGN